MTTGSVEVTILHMLDCPNVAVARRRVEEAIASLRLDARVRLVVVATEADAAELGFRGSPTIRIDDRDPFDDAGRDHLGCRLYVVDDHLEGAPSVAQLCDALRNRAAGRPLTL